ncbi:uncharacterized protein [Apostichopus japonicus]|uniref:uncharacterized protein n=1 Tax=Stichopus japonicus TaxID=307972 RepID=UPI003AB4090D
MQEARPAMSLTWLANTVEGYIQLNNITIFKHKTSTWTSFLTVTEPFIQSSYLSLLVCKAADPLNLLVHSEALTLVHNKGKETSQVDTTEVSVARNEKIELPCIDGHHLLLVWEMISTEDNISTPVVVDVDTANATYVISRDYELREGNLILRDVQLRHEGIYMCTYTHGTMGGVMLFNLVVYENPIPNYPIIDGCTQDRYCVLDVNYNEILRCAVKGIRPEVDLEWRVYHDDSAQMITFHGQKQLKTKSIDGTFDIILTTEFTVKDTSNDRLTVECRAVGTNAKLFQLTSKAELLFQGIVEPQTTNKIVNTDGSLPPTINNQYTFVFIIILVVAVGILMGACCIYLGYRKTRDPQVSTANIEENVPMVQNAGKVVIITRITPNYATKSFN